MDLAPLRRLHQVPRCRLDAGAVPLLPAQDGGLRRLPLPGVPDRGRCGRHGSRVLVVAASPPRGRRGGRGRAHRRGGSGRVGVPGRPQLPGPRREGMIEARGLGKDFGAVRALDGLDLDVGEAEFFGFLGPNGAGKTTTVHILATLLRPTRGSARIAGHDVMRESLAVRRSIGLVFQEPTLDRDLTVEENLRFAARLWDLSGPSTAARIDELLGQFGLAERRDSPVRALSGGLRRAADIARGVLHRPRVLFLDEPTAGLDPRARRTLWQFIRDLRAASGMTVFLTTHYVEEAEPCDRVAVLDRGHLVAQGTPAELKRAAGAGSRSEEHTSELQSPCNLVCRLLL